MRNAPCHSATVNKFRIHRHAAGGHVIIRQRLFKRCCRCRLRQRAQPFLLRLHTSWVCLCSAFAPSACCRFMLNLKLNSSVVNIGTRCRLWREGKRAMRSGFIVRQRRRRRHSVVDGHVHCSEGYAWRFVAGVGGVLPVCF